ncbi:hypothetical protein acdb102_10810 [Acidothermaceae bacterium B102]|nr:hypothetical protein acdb102_10810 [Acidothermaceae bacterium B102]
MTRTALRTRRSLRTKRAVSHRPAAVQTAAFIPASRDELDEANIWVVNAALENGQTELAYELADRYQRA